MKVANQINSQSSPIKDRKNNINVSPLSAFKEASKIKMQPNIFED